MMMKKILLTALVLTLASPALACEGFHNSLEALEAVVAKPKTSSAPADPATTQAPQPAPSQPASPPTAPAKK